MIVILVIWQIFAIVQAFMSYGTAYRYTKANGDNGISLFGWIIVFSLAALVPGLGIYLWRTSTSQDNNDRYTHTETQYFKKTCPFCIKGIQDYNAVFCPHCGKELNKKINDQIEEKIEFKEKYEHLNDIFNDEKIMNKAKEVRRFYGKDAYIRFLQDTARELGLGEIEINENDIE